MTNTVQIRIDVDSCHGLAHGVPFYLRLLKRYGFGATFFVPMGPNKLQQAVWRRLRQPLFWKQLWYFKPWSALSAGRRCEFGPEIGAGNPDMLKRIEDECCEVALHGYDHAMISNRAYSMTESEYACQIDKSLDLYVKTLGHLPQGTASPAWRCSEMILRVQDRYGFAYASDLCGKGPCFVESNGYVSHTIQIPTNVDTVFALVMKMGGDRNAALGAMKSQIQNEENPVLILHTEYDFLHFNGQLESLFSWLADRGYGAESFTDLNRCIERSDIPQKKLSYTLYEGAYGQVAVV